jgi:hypothetical protein
VIGLISGIVSVGIAYIVELVVQNLLGINALLWLVGPIEETSKLLVPIICLAFGVKEIKDPRSGLLAVLISAGVFGLGEGAIYQTKAGYLITHSWLPLQMAILRPASEIPHMFMAGFAAAVIWLAAYHRKRVITVAGVVAFLLAAGLHSVHDGVSTFVHQAKGNSIQGFSTSSHSLSQSIYVGIGGLFLGLLFAFPVYILLRHSARELVPPEAVNHNSKHWRPKIKHWGIHKQRQTQT